MEALTTEQIDLAEEAALHSIILDGGWEGSFPATEFPDWSDIVINDREVFRKAIISALLAGSKTPPA